MTRIPSAAQTYSKMPSRYDGKFRQAVRADGCYVWDQDNKKYVDMVAGLGPVILGHQDLDVDDAVQDQQERGICFPWPTALEEELAELLAGIFPCAEMTRFAKNGADATAAAVRIARAATGRDRIIRCGYHGYHDWCIKDSLGVSELQPVLTIRYNELEHLEVALQVAVTACVIMEPVVAADPVWPDEGYLQGVRDLCDKYGSLLIFDEMVTAFRLSLGGAQEYFGVTPDLACLGKAMANGYPLSAVVGRREYMKLLDEGVFFSTTFAGDALGLAAGVACVKKLKEQDVPEKLMGSGNDVWGAFWDRPRDDNILWGDAGRLKVYGYASRLVVKWENPEDERIFTKTMLDNGVAYQGYFNMMLAHDDEAIELVNDAISKSLEAVAEVVHA